MVRKVIFVADLWVGFNRFVSLYEINRVISI
jgi:hypothetical protein